MEGSRAILNTCLLININQGFLVDQLTIAHQQVLTDYKSLLTNISPMRPR
jgi:hypothetical protein